MQGFVVLFMNNFQYFGMAGALLITLVVVVAGLGYSGKAKERYSIFNHFISELGEVGVSQRARLFNLGLILSGICLLPFVIGLGLSLGDIWAKLGAVAGVWTAVSVACVGFFPMNNLVPHGRAALSYFRGGLVTILVFGVSILVQSAGQIHISPYANLVSLVAVIAYSTFLILLDRSDSSSSAGETLDPLSVPQRPKFWLLPFLEWLVFFSTILWFFGMAALI